METENNPRQPKCRPVKSEKPSDPGQPAPLDPERERRLREKMLDKTLADSYPASDPPSSIPDPASDDPGAADDEAA